MFPITITLHDVAQLNAVVAALAHLTGGASKPGLALESGELIPADKLGETKQAPGKPSAAKTAPSPRTAEAAPSPSAPSDAAPATQTTATEPAAAATSVAYPDLQKAVLTLHKMDPAAAVPIAKGLGADTFKGLVDADSLKAAPTDTKAWKEIKPGVWAEALRLVNEAIEARKVA